MPAPLTNGDQKYWFNGLPFEGVKKVGNDTGSQKYWFSGTVAESLFSLSFIKTINGLSKASIKTINGLAIASVKAWNGLT